MSLRTNSDFIRPASGPSSQNRHTLGRLTISIVLTAILLFVGVLSANVISALHDTLDSQHVQNIGAEQELSSGKDATPGISNQFDAQLEAQNSSEQKQRTDGLQTQFEATWKVYENKTYGYSFKYPPAAFANTTRTTPEHIELIVPLASYGVNLGGEYTFSIVVRDNPDGRTAKEWAYAQVDKSDAGRSAILEEGVFAIQGLQGYKIDQFSFDSEIYHVFLVRNRKSYEISYVDASSISLPESLSDAAAEKVRNQLGQLFKTMLESFRWN